MGCMAKKKYYAVVKGRRPGVYTNWQGSDGAEAQVKGFAGALFRGFDTPLEAGVYYESGGETILPPAAAAPENKPAPPPVPDADAALQSGAVVIFTDGASAGNPGPGGYGVVLRYGSSRKELSGGFRCTTNNRMELYACIAGLRALTNQRQVLIYSDSRYVVEAMRLGWAERWRENGWQRLTKESGARQPVENIDLWQELLELTDRYPVTFHWVKGHARLADNERCDRLAVAAAQGDHLPEDRGYQGSC